MRERLQHSVFPNNHLAYCDIENHSTIKWIAGRANKMLALFLIYLFRNENILFAHLIHFEC